MEAALNGPLGHIVLGPSPLTIGRAPDNGLVINDVKASGRHVELRPDGQGYAVVDVGSSNGTFVNEQRLKQNVPYSLHPNDVVRIGTTVFTYETSALFENAPTVYGPPVASGEPAYQPTIEAPPSYQEPVMAPPPPVYPSLTAGYDVPPLSADPYHAPPPVPPAPVVPPVAEQPEQPKKKRGNLQATLGIIAAIVIVLVLALGVLAYIGRSTPEKTLRTFCTDLQNNNDGDAYQQLSSGIRARESEATFASGIQQLFASAGGLRNCTSSVLSNDGTNSTGVMTWTLNVSPRPLVFNVRLLNENGAWKISGLVLRRG